MERISGEFNLVAWETKLGEMMDLLTGQRAQSYSQSYEGACVATLFMEDYEFASLSMGPS